MRMNGRSYARLSCQSQGFQRVEGWQRMIGQNDIRFEFFQGLNVFGFVADHFCFKMELSLSQYAVYNFCVGDEVFEVKNF